MALSTDGRASTARVTVWAQCPDVIPEILYFSILDLLALYKT
ncbi:hypothetical protein [Inquilinus sp. CAU 1745]